MIRKTPIKHQKRRCIICEKEQYIFSHHRCEACAKKQDREKKEKEKQESGEKPEVKIRTTIKRNSKPTNKALKTFFETHIEALAKFRVSEESGEAIPYPSNVNICHLLDKSRHKSVATHMDNCIYLTWEEHTRFDELLFAHEFEKVEKEFPNSWELIKSRLRIIIPLCTEKTKYLQALSNIVFNS